MTAQTLYIAGPMTGLPEWNYPAFFAAERELRAAGYQTLNPARHGSDEAKAWADWMRLGIADVLAADGVALLSGWVDSRGAWLETTVARSLEIPVRYVHDWLLPALGGAA